MFVINMHFPTWWSRSRNPVQFRPWLPLSRCLAAVDATVPIIKTYTECD